MSHNQFQFKAELSIYSGKAAWHYVTVPRDVSLEIHAGFGDMHRGWGSLPVLVCIGITSWRTSIFYERKNETYMLPVKGEVRVCERLQVGDVVDIGIEILA